MSYWLKMKRSTVEDLDDQRFSRVEALIGIVLNCGQPDSFQD